MQKIKSFTDGYVNLPVRQLDDGSVQFDAEQAAIGFGISFVAKSGTLLFVGNVSINIYRPQKWGCKLKKVISSLSHNFTNWLSRLIVRKPKSFNIG
nr:hypothetical protein [Lactiplantibacillus plantarum]